MRTVVSSTEVAHLWAHRAQEHARNSSGTVKFIGSMIYSYGHHFPIAAHVTNHRGESAVLFTTRSYSVTTHKHCGYVRRAIPSSVQVFNVPLERDTRERELLDGTRTEKYLASYQERVRELEEKIARARKPEYWYAQLDEIISEANQFATWIGSTVRFESRADYTELRKELQVERKRELEEKRARQAQLEKEKRALIEQWCNGEKVHLPWSLERTYLRVVGNEVETSKGARFPVHHAMKGLELVRRVRANAVDWTPPESKSVYLGVYKIDRISAGGDVKAGCHLVRWEEITRVMGEIERAVGAADRAVVEVHANA